MSGTPAARREAEKAWRRTMWFRRFAVTIGILITIGAWAVAIATESDFSPWFAIGFWSLIAVGYILRMLRPGRAAKEIVGNPFEQAQEIYLGRAPASPPASDTNATSQIGEPPTRDPLQLPRSDRRDPLPSDD